MTIATIPRLPRELTTGGASVAVRLPLEPGAVAHRPYRDTVPAAVRWGNPDRKEHVVLPNCARHEDPCGEFTAAWADAKGAQACTEPLCFPEAGAR